MILRLPSERLKTAEHTDATGRKHKPVVPRSTDNQKNREPPRRASPKVSQILTRKSPPLRFGQPQPYLAPVASDEPNWIGVDQPSRPHPGRAKVAFVGSVLGCSGITANGSITVGPEEPVFDKYHPARMAPHSNF